MREIPLSDYYTPNVPDPTSDDYEELQAAYLSSPNDNFRNEEFFLTPYEKPYRLENWPQDDLVMYVGGNYAKEAYSK